MKRIVNSLLVLIFLFLYQMGLTQNLESIKKEKPFDWSGSIGVNTGMYQSNGPNARQNPLIWNLSARLKGKFYGFDLPFSFSFGNNQFSFTRPYFQLGIKPQYKWLKLHIGTSSMKLSEYTLRGHRFDGVGVELTPGKFRFSAMKGRLRRARDYNPDIDNRFNSIVYKRTGTALKIGYGTENSYIDLIYFKAKDDPTSVKSFPIDTTILPAENAVAGLSTKIKIYQGINVIADGAISAYTRNQNSLETEDFTPDVSSFFKTRQSTRLNYAFNSGVQMNFSSWGLGINYERIAPEFETMGAYFFANDRERISIRPNLRMANGKVRLNGNLGIETNNLLENRAQKTKQLTGMINLSYFNPNGLGFNANYSNLSVEQKAGLAELIDTFRVALVTKNITIMPSYTWSDTSKSQSIHLSIISQGLNDKNPFTREYTQMNMRTINANYMLSLLATSASINFGLNYTHIELPSNITLRTGFNLGFNKSFNKNLWTFGTSLIYNTSKLNNTKDGSVITANLNLGFSPTDKSNFNLNCNLLRNNSDAYNNYTEFYGAISFTHRLK